MPSRFSRLYAIPLVAAGVATSYALFSAAGEGRLNIVAAATDHPSAASSSGSRVRLERVPNDGIQPEAVRDSSGTLQLLYFKGDAAGGDLYYVHRAEDGKWSNAMRVNSASGSAIAMGTIRGGQIAIGRNGRIHVAWNGSGAAPEKGPVSPDNHHASSPMLYSRMNSQSNGFEPERNLMTRSADLDGGGTVAADANGDVWVAWHGHPTAPGGKPNEAGREVMIAKSSDDGASFSKESPAWNNATGTCGCCEMRMFADRRGDLFGLYRSAAEMVHRDIYLLESTDRGRTFNGRMVQPWNIGACPMSSMSFAEAADGTVYGAWETNGQVYFEALNRPGATPIAAPGEGKRKHPRLAVNRNGEVLLTWAEGTGWKKGGSLGWQVFDAKGSPEADQHGLTPGIPAWSFTAPVANADRTFTVLY